MSLSNQRTLFSSLESKYESTKWRQWKITKFGNTLGISLSGMRNIHTSAFSPCSVFLQGTTTKYFLLLHFSYRDCSSPKKREQAVTRVISILTAIRYYIRWNKVMSRIVLTRKTLRIKVKKERRGDSKERKTIGAITIAILLLLSSLCFFFYRYSVVLLAATAFAVCRVSSRMKHWGKNSSFARARYCTRVYLCTYIDKYRYYVQHECPCNVLRSVSERFSFFGQNSYRFVNLHEQSLASAVARLERGETCAASYISLWAKGESGRGVGGATEASVGEDPTPWATRGGIIGKDARLRRVAVAWRTTFFLALVLAFLRAHW